MGIIEELLILAEMHERPRRGRMTLEQLARLRKTLRRKRRNAWRARVKAGLPRRRAPNAKFGWRIRDRLLLAMVPGEWWSQNDIVKAAGCAVHNGARMQMVLRPGGYVVRARNPERISPEVRIVPRWLYKLTAKGEAMRELCLMLR